MHARVMFDVHADVLVLKRRDRLLGHAGRWRSARRSSPDGYLLAEKPRLRGDPLRYGAAGSQACACCCRFSAAGNTGRQLVRMMSRLREISEILQRKLVAVDGRRAFTPAEPGDRHLQTVFEESAGG